MFDDVSGDDASKRGTSDDGCRDDASKRGTSDDGSRVSTGGATDAGGATAWADAIEFVEILESGAAADARGPSDSLPEASERESGATVVDVGSAPALRAVFELHARCCNWR